MRQKKRANGQMASSSSTPASAFASASASSSASAAMADEPILPSSNKRSKRSMHKDEAKTKDEHISSSSSVSAAAKMVVSTATAIAASSVDLKPTPGPRQPKYVVQGLSDLPRICQIGHENALRVLVSMACWDNHHAVCMRGLLESVRNGHPNILQMLMDAGCLATKEKSLRFLDGAAMSPQFLEYFGYWAHSRMTPPIARILYSIFDPIFRTDEGGLVAYIRAVVTVLLSEIKTDENPPLPCTFENDDKPTPPAPPSMEEDGEMGDGIGEVAESWFDEETGYMKESKVKAKEKPMEITDDDVNEVGDREEETETKDTFRLGLGFLALVPDAHIVTLAREFGRVPHVEVALHALHNKRYDRLDCILQAWDICHYAPSDLTFAQLHKPADRLKQPPSSVSAAGSSSSSSARVPAAAAKESDPNIPLLQRLMEGTDAKMRLFLNSETGQKTRAIARMMAYVRQPIRALSDLNCLIWNDYLIVHAVLNNTCFWVSDSEYYKGKRRSMKWSNHEISILFRLMRRVARTRVLRLPSIKLKLELELGDYLPEDLITEVLEYWIGSLESTLFFYSDISPDTKAMALRLAEEQTPIPV